MYIKQSGEKSLLMAVNSIFKEKDQMLQTHIEMPQAFLG